MSVASRATTATTLAEAFRITAEDFSDRVAVRTKDDEVSLTWGDLRERVDALAGGLAALGVRGGVRGRRHRRRARARAGGRMAGGRGVRRRAALARGRAGGRRAADLH